MHVHLDCLDSVDVKVKETFPVTLLVGVSPLVSPTLQDARGD